MFTRQTMQEIENNMSQSGPNITRLEGVARGVLTVIQLLIPSLAIPEQLWAAGVGAAIAAAPADGKPAGSQYTRRWWLALQMALAVFTVALRTPVNVLASLAVTDGEQFVLSPDNQLIRPFAVFDPEAVAAEFQAMPLALLVFSDPETDAPVIVPEPVIEPEIPA